MNFTYLPSKGKLRDDDGVVMMTGVSCERKKNYHCRDSSDIPIHMEPGLRKIVIINSLKEYQVAFYINSQIGHIEKGRVILTHQKNEFLLKLILLF